MWGNSVPKNAAHNILKFLKFYVKIILHNHASFNYFGNLFKLQCNAWSMGVWGVLEEIPKFPLSN